MKYYLLALLGCALLLSSCTKTGSLSPATDNTGLVAKMAAYGYKPYTGPLTSSIRALPSKTFEEFKTAQTIALPLDGQSSDESLVTYPSGEIGDNISLYYVFIFPHFFTGGYYPYKFTLGAEAPGGGGSVFDVVSDMSNPQNGLWSYVQDAYSGYLSGSISQNGEIDVAGRLEYVTVVMGIPFYSNYNLTVNVSIAGGGATAIASITPA